jgi:hypothetical protein
LLCGEPLLLLSLLSTEAAKFLPSCLDEARPMVFTFSHKCGNRKLAMTAIS